jgi:hypothetical protein
LQLDFDTIYTISLSRSIVGQTRSKTICSQTLHEVDNRSSLLKQERVRTTNVTEDALIGSVCKTETDGEHQEMNKTDELCIFTWMPETVKYGISNFTRMGGRFSGVSSSGATLGRLNLARSMYSCEDKPTR